MDKSLPDNEAAAQLANAARACGLKPLRLRGKSVLPVVQGGMGVGVSAGGLAGAVAALGGVGTISSVDLRRHHPDLMAQTAHLTGEVDTRQRIDRAFRRADSQRAGIDAMAGGGHGAGQ